MEKIKQITLFYLKKEQKRDILTIDAPVAQLDRASASGVEGRGFESRRVYLFFCLFRGFELKTQVLSFFLHLRHTNKVRLVRLVRLVRQSAAPDIHAKSDGFPVLSILSHHL